MIVYILLDAFRGDYITQIDTPFLHSMIKDDKKNVFYRDVIPSLSFCERTEIFSGIEPADSLLFTAFKKDPDKSEFKKFKPLLNILHSLELSLKLKGNSEILYRKIVGKIFKLLKIKSKIYNIPLNEIWKYSLSEDYDDIRKASFENNIFKLFSEKNLKVLYKTFTSLSGEFISSDSKRIEFLKNEYINFDFSLLYIGETDSLGHEHGPSSSIFKNYLRRLDNALENIIKIIESNSDATIIINGDHGMSDVTFHFDVKEHIKSICKQNNVEPSCIDLFIDSTLLRIYTSSKIAKELILEDELLKKNGAFVYQNSTSQFKTFYGDIIWCINSGGLILPNYFQFKKVNGMHGYIPVNQEHYGTLIIRNPKSNCSKKRQIKLIDVNKIIRKEIYERFKN